MIPIDVIFGKENFPEITNGIWSRLTAPKTKAPNCKEKLLPKHLLYDGKKTQKSLQYDFPFSMGNADGANK